MLDVLPFGHHDRDGSVVIHLAGTILRNKNHPDYDDNENLKAKHQLNQRTEFSLRILTVLINVAFAAKRCAYLTYGQILTKLLQLDCP